ncbi:MAG: right-handed parallel beta-helix repeat-containing protein [Verrucomicrobiia bacterium]
MRTPVRFCCGVLLTTALMVFNPGPDRSGAFAATTITVTTTNSGVPGSLDQAILQGNTDSPPVTINFAIPPFNGTVQTIVLQSNLPAITSPLAINGFTQSGSSPGAFPGTLTNNPVLLIALDGSAASAVQTSTGLTFAVAGSVQGLIIQNFTNGVAVSVMNGVTLSENAISNNLVGVECSGDTNSITGNVLVLNGTAIQLFGSSNTCTTNVVTNNLNNGLDVFGANNSIIGNLISANSSNGVDLAGGANSFASNIISSNIGAGVVINGNNNTLSNNTISANDADGVDIGGSGNNLVNSTVATNLGAGVNVSAFPGTTNGNNTLSVDILSANGGGGVLLAGGANSLVASTISSNTGDGVLVSGTANIIGGTASGAGNVIIQNTGNGIDIAGSNEPSLFPADANVVQGNFIGTDATGTNSLGNTESGVLIDGTLAAASTNLIGGELSGQANTIAFNGSNGVTVVSTAVDNAIFANSIFTNALLGIDLGADGVTSNHPFGTFPTGPNNFQNFPVLTAVLCSNGGILVQGSITNSAGSTPVHLEFFANTVCDPSGYGQGQVFFGSADVTTDLSGGATFSLPFSNSDLVGQFITATASDSSSNTSEFSQCILVPNFTNAVLVINNCTNITASVGSAQLSAVVTFPTPTAANNCLMPTTVTCVPASGAIFPLGTTPVTCTATDGAGNTASCTFSVTVTAPEQVIVDIAPGFCPAVVNTNEGGVIHVAIVGTQSLNVSNIIPASVTLNGVLATGNYTNEDVAAPFVYTRGCPKKKHDGIPDLVVEFNVNELIASLGTVKNGEVKVLTVNGKQNIIGTTFTTNDTVITTNENVVIGTSTFEGQDKIKISTEKSNLPPGLQDPF